MVDYGRGVKAGAVAGIAHGIISGILTFLAIQMLFPGDWSAIFVPSQAAQISMGMIIATLLGSSLVGGIIGGIIFGVIYAAVYDSLPGGSSINKGIVLSLGFWIIFGLVLGYGTVSAMMTASGAAAGAYLVVNLISALIWGALVGILWDRFA